MSDHSAEPSRTDVATTRGQARKTLLASPLILSSFVLYIPQVVTSLLLIEIAASFDVEVGVAGQIRTASALISLIGAFLMGSLSVRFSHKTLLLTGLLALCVSMLGSSLSPSFGALLLFYSLYGCSMALVLPMSMTLVGRLFSMDDRPKVLSYIIAGGAAAYLVSSPIMDLIGDWRLTFQIIVLPLSALTLLLALLGLPATPPTSQTRPSLLQGFKAVARNRSAMACVLGNTLAVTGFLIIQTYSMPFYRQRHLLDRTVTSVLVSGMALVYVFSSLLGGRLVTRIGRWRQNVLFAFSNGILVIASLLVPNVLLSVVAFFIGCASGGMRGVASQSLTLEQVPAYRGTMMSLYQVSSQAGSAIGTAVGGYLLVVADYEALSGLGVLTIVGGLIFYLFTVDPTQNGDTG